MSVGSIGQQIINGTYGLDNRPPTAYEELKAWCEKHLKANEYIIGEDYPHIDFYPPCNCEIAVWFKPNGEYDFAEIYD